MSPIQAQVFSGHESFPLRFAWLTKAVRCGDVFNDADAMVTLGVGKNMVRSIRWWAVNTGMLCCGDNTASGVRLEPSELGTTLFGKDGVDSFMEDPATIWLVHWALATNTKLATWFWMFNKFRETEFERGQLVDQLTQFSREASGRQIASDTIGRDVDCFIRTYVPTSPDKRLSREETLDCPLTELGLIRRNGNPHGFSFVRGRRESLCDEVFAYCLLEFWNQRAAKSESLGFDDAAYGAGSPGQVFKLTENALVDRLHGLGNLTGNKIRYDDTAGLKQIFRTGRVSSQSLLSRHYGHASKGGTDASD